MANTLTAAEFADLDLADWRVLLQRIEATFQCSGYGAAGELVAAIARLADEHDHHPAVDLRYPGVVHVTTTTHSAAGLTSADVALARAISELAARSGAVSRPLAANALEIALDAMDIDLIRPFWAAVLGYVERPAEPGNHSREVVDPAGVSPALWFQQMDVPRTERNRFHLDIVVPHEIADQRVAAAIAAGGRLLSDAHARAFWVLADPEGNEVCVCTWQDRDA